MAIRRFVEMGFGIGVVAGLPDRPPSPGLHQRSLSRFVGGTCMNFVRRRDGRESEVPQAFVEMVQATLSRRRPGRRRAPARGNRSAYGAVGGSGR